MVLCPIDSQKWLPWKETITLTSHRAAGDVSVQVRDAGCYPAGGGEAAPSNGVYTQSDATFTVSTRRLTFDPKPGDFVTWNGDSYTVLRVNRSKWLSFWTIAGRNLKIAADLQDACDVLRPAPAPTAAGDRTPNFTTLVSGAACRLQPADWQGERGAGEIDEVLTRRRYTCYLAVQQVLAAGDVIVSGGVKYEVTGQSDISRIDRLNSVACERIE